MWVFVFVEGGGVTAPVMPLAAAATAVNPPDLQAEYMQLLLEKLVGEMGEREGGIGDREGGEELREQLVIDRSPGWRGEEVLHPNEELYMSSDATAQLLLVEDAPYPPPGYTPPPTPVPIPCIG